MIENSKHNKSRCIPVDEKILELARKYDQLSRLYFPLSSFFFVDSNGGKMTALSLNYFFDKIWKLSLLEKDEKFYYSPYIFRHIYASHILIKAIKNNDNILNLIQFVSTYMGHENINNTLYYFHLIPEKFLKNEKYEIYDILGDGKDEKED